MQFLDMLVPLTSNDWENAKTEGSLQIEWLQNAVGLVEAEIWTFEVAQQGYLPLGVDRPVLNTGTLGRPGDRNFQHWVAPWLKIPLLFLLEGMCSP